VSKASDKNFKSALFAYLGDTKQNIALFSARDSISPMQSALLCYRPPICPPVYHEESAKNG